MYRQMFFSGAFASVFRMFLPKTKIKTINGVCYNGFRDAISALCGAFGQPFPFEHFFNVFDLKCFCYFGEGNMFSEPVLLGMQFSRELWQA